MIAVFFNGSPADGKETRQVCPTQTTTYTLRATSSTGTQDRTVTIVVGTGHASRVEFTTDTNQVVMGQCATLRWRAVNVSKVYLTFRAPQGVAGRARSRCALRWTRPTNSVLRAWMAVTTTKSLPIKVVPADSRSSVSGPNSTRCLPARVPRCTGMSRMRGRSS